MQREDQLPAPALQALQAREDINANELELPPCILPRPGDSVVWFTDSDRRVGVLLGHGPGGVPVVRNRNGFTIKLRSYDAIRLENQQTRVGPNWTYLGARAAIKRPRETETTEFSRILNQPIPPGPTYLELIQEIWHRGFEVFLVGGTVRDVVSGVHANDVDIVTSMPLNKALPLLATMYRLQPSISKERGFVRLGGTPKSGDPFIDLKSLVYSDPGTPDAIFSSAFDNDLWHRDFACNSIYYDPINDALIDPSGCGIANAEQRSLELVCDPELRPPFYRAQILIRFFKFICRGYTPTERTAELIRRSFVPSIAAMRRTTIISYVRTQLLSKAPRTEHARQLELFNESVVAFGAEEIWVNHFAPVLDDILLGGEE